MSKQKVEEVTIKVLTANAAGGKPPDQRKPKDLGDFIRKKDIDFVFLQELAELKWKDKTKDNVLEEIRDKASTNNYEGFFAPTVSTSMHPCPLVVPRSGGKRGKWYSKRFVPEGKGAPLKAAQGNGFLINTKKWEVKDIWDGTLSPTPATVQISQPSLFEGDRETEPRCLSLIRVKGKSIGSNIACQMFLGCTHLTTLRQEEKSLGKGKQATEIRQAQTKQIIQILAQLQRRTLGEIPIIIAGDFNAELGSPDLYYLNEVMKSATESCSNSDKKKGTHKERGTFIDHIWFYPDTYFTVKKCKLSYKLEKVSDHRPVYAELVFSIGLDWVLQKTEKQLATF
jgi:endonuclease/exonuclease/phosphatase family metal-dependent hydrolase